ncbi:MAG: phosphomannomutase/phosphoglucomutase, partial [Pseudomonadota bacterium]
SPTMGAFCPDEQKYETIRALIDRLSAMADAGERLGERKIEKVVTVNGARVLLEGGAWALVRASSNEPKLVVVCESPNSDAELRNVFKGLDEVIRERPEVGEYDQTF